MSGGLQEELPRKWETDRRKAKNKKSHTWRDGQSFLGLSFAMHSTDLLLLNLVRGEGQLGRAAQTGIVLS